MVPIKFKICYYLLFKSTKKYYSDIFYLLCKFCIFTAESTSNNEHEESSNDCDPDFTMGSSDSNFSGSESSEESIMDPVDTDNSLDDMEQNTNDPNSNANWWTPTTATKRSFSFSGTEKLHTQVNSSSPNNTVLPVDVYKLFVSDAVIDYIVEETNRYADQILESQTVTRKSLLSNWVPTTKDEMKRFFGIVICMGLVNMPTIECYWSKKQFYDYGFVKNNMSRNRFFLLLRMVHFNDNETFEKNQRLQKIQPLLEMLTGSFKSVYSPGEKLVVDESLIPFRGRLLFRHYIPGKSHKYGIKLYKICTPNGYTWNLQVYSGNLANEPEYNHSESVVLKLARPILGCGATIYADNFYSSVPLAEKLLKEKTYYCGTLQKNRKMLPPDVMKSKLKRGELVGKMNNSGVKVCHWKDKKNVFTLSTIPEHNGQLKSTGKKNRKGQEILKPSSVIDYNAAKVGVEKSDQMTCYNSILRKSTKWYRKLAFELLLGTSMVNAWVLYNKFFQQQGKQMPILDFKESIMMSLVTGTLGMNLKPGPSSSVVSGIRSSHSLVEVDGPKSMKRKRCRGCYEQISAAEGSKVARSKARRISTYCDSCDGKPYLCISCFNMKHSS